MGTRLVLLALGVAAAVAALGACGKEIGDSCVLSSDCSPNGDRLCLCSLCNGSAAQSSDEGYCTVLGCDYSTCPEEAACIRFFTGNFANKSCTKATEAMACTLDELCSVAGKCVPRASEVRYCMRTCGSNGDCRDGYECRDLAKMKEHGGEPVPAPNVPVDEQPTTKFCAKAP